jgi:hypothetical protein
MSTGPLPSPAYSPEALPRVYYQGYFLLKIQISPLSLLHSTKKHEIYLASTHQCYVYPNSTQYDLASPSILLGNLKSTGPFRLIRVTVSHLTIVLSKWFRLRCTNSLMRFLSSGKKFKCMTLDRGRWYTQLGLYHILVISLPVATPKPCSRALCEYSFSVMLLISYSPLLIPSNLGVSSL